MDELAAKAREMIADPNLKASGLAAATTALKSYAAYRQEEDRHLPMAEEGIVLPRKGVLKPLSNTAGTPGRHDGAPP